jgi:hypothetical protein
MDGWNSDPRKGTKNLANLKNGTDRTDLGSRDQGTLSMLLTINIRQTSTVPFVKCRRVGENEGGEHDSESNFGESVLCALLSYSRAAKLGWVGAEPFLRPARQLCDWPGVCRAATIQYTLHCTAAYVVQCSTKVTFLFVS